MLSYLNGANEYRTQKLSDNCLSYEPQNNIYAINFIVTSFVHELAGRFSIKKYQLKMRFEVN